MNNIQIINELVEQNEKLLRENKKLEKKAQKNFDMYFEAMNS